VKSRPVVDVYPFPGLYGWMMTAAVVVGFDVWAHFNDRPTMSRTMGHFLAQPVLGPILAGAWSALAYHLLIEERLTNIDSVLMRAKSLSEIVTPPSQD
jgi:hypothetical protein